MTNPTNILRQVLFHPVGALAVEPFHDGDVRHGCGCRGAGSMLLTRREPDHVTRPNLLDWASPALCQAAASRHDQGLAHPDCFAIRLTEQISSIGLFAVTESHLDSGAF